jgi:hypothetical protein
MYICMYIEEMYIRVCRSTRGEKFGARGGGRGGGIQYA